MNSKAPGGKCKRDADTGRQAREDFPKDGMVELQTEGQERQKERHVPRPRGTTRKQSKI